MSEDQQEDIGPVESETETSSDVETNATVSTDYKVRGKKDAPDGTGVLGHNTASTGTAYGVEGVSETDADMSGDDYPAGVFGTVNGSGRTIGLRGDTDGPGASGMLGIAADDSFEPSFNASYPVGVVGYTRYSSETSGATGAAGVNAVATSTSGTAHGVLAQTSAPDGYGVYSIGDTYVGGHQDVTNVGVSAYLSSNFTIPSGTTTQVEFDAEEADHFAAFDTSTGTFTVPEDGDYHVDFTIRWADNFSTGDDINYRLLVNGATSRGIYGDVDIKGDGEVTHGYSKALFGLSSDDTIELEIFQNGGDKDIYGDSNQQHSYLTIHKIG